MRKKRVLKNIFKIIAIFIVGTIGGIFADQILWPYFIERPLFYEYRLDRYWLQQQPIYVTENVIERITIRENIALEEAIEKVKKTVVGIKAEIAIEEGLTEKEILIGSGLIVTRDGLIVTLSDLLPKGSDFYFWVNGEWPTFKILKRDTKNNLALVKIEKGDLQTCGFADFEKIVLGERVFLVGLIPEITEKGFITSWQRIVNEGIIKRLDENLIETNITEKANVAGAPLFDIEGNLVGLVRVDEEGNINAIPVKTIREFLGF